MKTIREYLEKPKRCPKCDSSNITTQGSLQIDDHGAWQDITCVSCGFEYTDFYKLSHYEECK